MLPSNLRVNHQTGSCVVSCDDNDDADDDDEEVEDDDDDEEVEYDGDDL